MNEWPLVIGVVGVILTLLKAASTIGAKIEGVQTSVNDLKGTVGQLTNGVDALRDDFSEMRRDHAVLEQRVAHMETTR